MGGRTERLYHGDPFGLRFQAKVLEARPEAVAAGGPRRQALLLDRTAFYPTGGGQPHDTGSLGGLTVVDVRETPEGPLHIVEVAGRREPAVAGATIEGQVNPARRFDHMQHHSGQHLLTRAFIEVASAETRGFHLGESICTIDVDLPSPSEEVVRAAERRTNEIIWEDRPVMVREADAGDEAGPVTKPGDSIRTIEVEGFDSTPCGGTHVLRTGQVGILCVTAWEPYKRMCRVTFLCGGRVADHVQRTGATLARCVSMLSAPPPEIPEALDKALSEREGFRKELKASRRELARYEAQALVEAAEPVGGYRLVRKTFDGSTRSVEEVQILAREITAGPGRAALLTVTAGETVTLLAARSQGEGPDLGRAVGEACREAGGRGGGSPVVARGGNIPRDRLPTLLDRIVRALGPGEPEHR